MTPNDRSTKYFRPLPPLPAAWDSLGHAFLSQARSRPHALAVVDSTGAKLTYKQLLTASMALANLLHDKLNDSPAVGILLPPSAGGVIANIAVTLMGKAAINLNYSIGQKVFDSCVSQGNLTYIISSDKFIKRIGLDPKVPVIRLEDVKEHAGVLDKVKSWYEAGLMPEGLLGHFMPGLKQRRRVRYLRGGRLEHGSSQSDGVFHDPATVIFTSGSTGVPKGVVLSHKNVLSNVHAIRLHGHVTAGETVLGVIPFFHSFGFTMTLWAPLCLGEMVVYHYDPLDSRRIAELCERYAATTMVSTPTIMSSYLRRCDPRKFDSVVNCILGGEKLRAQQFEEIERLLGRAPLEGYGLTETSPVIACNVPGDVEFRDGRLVAGTRPGTVGMPLPGTTIRIRDQVTGEEVPAGTEGMITIKGPQVMVGYLNRPEETAKVLKDGWFTTGDLGFLDRDGFLTVTGRLSQFSKIAGEMISHLAVEEEIIKASGHEQVSVTSVPDDKRGERLVVVHTPWAVTAQEVVARLKEAQLAGLMIPDTRDFLEIQEMPLLKNGKLDLVSIKKFVQSRYSEKVGAADR